MKNTVYIDNFTLPAEQSQRFYFERNLLILNFVTVQGLAGLEKTDGVD